ncbi:MAG: nicotinate-nucleotide adenylyltransferase [Candidatus Eisenbacteria bacterium]|nr:nicotinate-nucleotide adenylyltransferase [Candidatus Eisenbacteria bacterium]
MKIGLFGGTFDPIHVGHLMIAEEARERLGLDRVIFVPSGISPHKNRLKISSPESRLEMTRLGIDGNEHFEFSDFEVKRQSTSFTIETVSCFKNALGNEAEIFLVVGADSILEISMWKEPQRLVSACRPVVLNRPGFDLRKLEPWLRDRALILDGMLVGISSTDIRERVATGRSIRYLVPPSVAAYVFDHRLYTGASKA